MAADGDTDPKPIGKATAQLDKLTTVELQCDKHDPDFARWFDTGTDHQGVAMPHVRKGNDVTALVDGKETYEAMVDAIRTATGSGHFIYLLGWFLDIDFNLARGTNIRALFTAASAATPSPVEVRAMLWQQKALLATGVKVVSLGFANPNQNVAEVKFINGLPSGAAILDNRTLNFGAHHQKILIVNGSQGLVAFCGGLDINPDRIDHIPKVQPGSPMHDVHCRIQGPAAFDLLRIFVQRWTDHPDAAKLPAAKRSLTGAAVPDPGDAGTNGAKFVQIGRTFGNGSNHAGIEFSVDRKPPFKHNHGYSFAPNGEQTARQIITHAIQAAREFIYIEDQYLCSTTLSDVLRDQLDKIKKLIVLIPHSSISDLPGVWKRRKVFIDNLLSKGNVDKVAICVPFPDNIPRPSPLKIVDKNSFETYVHAKMYVMDDKFAIIGSANCNSRGIRHDSEVVAGIYDESLDAPCTRHFAHDLRIKLWSEHLVLPKSALFDPIASSIVWFSPGTTTRIARYDHNADTDSTLSPSSHLPDSLVDPDGS
jgi:phosphatidylserine/phosphatidylglycerophosphate/cardiolipin synthase-like enzyme